jgi:EmrB/QacA subfamily drug resistance transporter
MAMLDGTVVNVALRAIGKEFDASFAALQWTVNGYTLTLASLILIGGSFGDRFGRRRIFLIGVLWFAVASLLCGAAPNVGVLIAARALQGIGGALLTPGSLAIISASFAKSDRPAAVGAWSGLGGIAAAAGPLVGGWLLELNWRWVFFVNAPVALAVLLITVRHVPESRDEQADGRVDIVGAVLTVIGLAGLTYSLTSAGDAGMTASVLASGVAGIAALAAFMVAQQRSRRPLAPPAMFRNVQFSASNAATFLMYGGLSAMMVLLVLQLQVVAGFSPILAGSSLLPVTLLMLALSARVGALSQRIGPRWLMTVGPMLCGSGVLLLLRVGGNAHYISDVLPAVVIFGLGLSLTVAPLTSTVLAAAEDRHAGVASGVNNAIARAAGLLAIAVVPTAAGISGADYANSAAFNSGFDTAMVICAGLFFATGLLSLGLIRNGVRTASVSAPETDIHVEQCTHCGINAPQLHPAECSAQESVSSDA